MSRPSSPALITPRSQERRHRRGLGVDTSGQIDVPSTVIDAVAIAAGWDHSLALLADGTVVPWVTPATASWRHPAV